MTKTEKPQHRLTATTKGSAFLKSMMATGKRTSIKPSTVQNAVLVINIYFMGGAKVGIFAARYKT